MKTITPVQIRFADIDILGHVNNVNMQHYFDLGKTDFFLQNCRFDQRTMARSLIVKATATQYEAQTFFHDTLRVVTDIKEVGNKSFKLIQQIIDQNDQVKAICESVMVAFDYDHQCSCEIPSEWKTRFLEGLAQQA